MATAKSLQADTTVKLDLDSSDPFDAVIIDMYRTNRSKRQDYAGLDHPYQNFIDSAYQNSSTPGMSCEVLIATKQSRLRNLLRDTDVDPSNESVEDTILDRAVYSAIALGLYRLGMYNPESVVVAGITSR